ncbi:MAG: thioredoxin family protein, partial [Bacteroidota bacterium]
METFMYKTAKEEIQDSLPKAIYYEQYRAMVSDLAFQGKSTAPEQTDTLTGYTTLNDRRMARFDKTVKLDETSRKRITSITQKFTFLVLTE